MARILVEITSKRLDGHEQEYVVEVVLGKLDSPAGQAKVLVHLIQTNNLDDGTRELISERLNEIDSDRARARVVLALLNE